MHWCNKNIVLLSCCVCQAELYFELFVCSWETLFFTDEQMLLLIPGLKFTRPTSRTCSLQWLCYSFQAMAALYPLTSHAETFETEHQCKKLVVKWCFIFFQLTVFKPFFVSLNLPYSVVRGEQLVLQAIVFNYMNKDTDVTVTLPASDEYMSIMVDAAGNTRNVKKTEIVTVKVS